MPGSFIDIGSTIMEEPVYGYIKPFSHVNKTKKYAFDTFIKVITEIKKEEKRHLTIN